MDSAELRTGSGVSGRLQDRVVIVTGSGQGLGLGIAHALADAGAAVALLGRTESKVVAAAEDIAAKGGRALAVRCDVGVREDVDAAVATVLAEFGQIDALVNNAQGGNLSTFDATTGVSEEAVLECFRTGPLGSLFMMQACFDALRDSGHGVVLNFGSGIGVRGAPGMAPYSMAKEALNGLTKTTAQEWGKHGIRVNLVAPVGLTPASEVYRDENPERWQKHLRATPLRRMGDPYEDIGLAVVSLVGDELKYLTGATLMLDGGQVLLR